MSFFPQTTTRTAFRSRKQVRPASTKWVDNSRDEREKAKAERRSKGIGKGDRGIFREFCKEIYYRFFERLEAEYQPAPSVRGLRRDERLRTTYTRSRLPVEADAKRRVVESVGCRERRPRVSSPNRFGPHDERREASRDLERPEPQVGTNQRPDQGNVFGDCGRDSSERRRAEVHQFSRFFLGAILWLHKCN